MFLKNKMSTDYQSIGRTIVQSTSLMVLVLPSICRLLELELDALRGHIDKNLAKGLGFR
jgi:hypothetical protein